MLGYRGVSVNALRTFASIPLCLFAAYAQNPVNPRPSLILESKVAKVVVDLAGGSISDFHLTGLPLNPFTWDSKGDTASPRPMGHFLCLDRWGAPSTAEQRNGMPFHGEASRVLWRVLTPPAAKGDRVEATMAASLPLAGLEVTRRIHISTAAPFFVVMERVTNRNKLGRIYNMVQHPTIGPPFLDEETLVDTNAKTGFMQNSPLPNPEQPSVEWPNALNKGEPVDLRRLTKDPEPNVVSYTIADENGWVTASSASAGLLVGYIWKTEEYPWFNAWRHVEKGRPAARGLEFGTTGLHQPYPTLVKKGRIFDRPLYTYLDAGQTESRSYACFLLKIPKDYKGVERVQYANGGLQIYERGGGRQMSLNVGKLFPETE
jgi:hypothetical protein